MILTYNLLGGLMSKIEFKEFVKLEEEIILPNDSRDGFYICKMRKEKTCE